MGDDDDVKSRNDVLAPPRAPRLSSPVAVKITTVITNSVKEVAILVAVCSALFMGKISADQFLMVIVGMGMGHYARTKAEGAVGEQTLVEMTEAMTDAEQLKQALDELREISADLKMIVHEARADKRRITVLEMKVAEIDGRLLEVEDDHQNGSST